MNDQAKDNGPVLEARNVRKTYRQGPREVSVLKDVSLALDAGESLSIIGVSGAGKSTLLHILGGLDEPDEGEVRVNGEALWSLKAIERSRVRNRAMGFVYQFHHLLPDFSALENVVIPQLIYGAMPAEAEERAGALLDRLDRAHIKNCPLQNLLLP